jgi:hypothetical protein
VVLYDKVHLGWLDEVDGMELITTLRPETSEVCAVIAINAGSNCHRAEKK